MRTVIVVASLLVLGAARGLIEMAIDAPWLLIAAPSAALLAFEGTRRWRGHATKF